MTNQNVLDFSPEGALGRVFRVDTGSVWAEALDHELLTRVAVGSLVAIQGANASEYLIGLLDRVTRDVYEDADGETDEVTDNDVPEARQRDLLRVVLVGTYRTVEGDRVNTFKRGSDSYPLIDASCWAISGSNLQRLMGLLSQKVDPERRLNLGTFVADASAEAVADGDRLFQRHAALLGSTGSGKSWAVALILEKAKRLAHPNLIVFDMHGEYGPLTEGDEPLAKGFKVANPGIAEGDRTEVLNLPWWLLNQEEMQALLLDRSETNAPNQAARLSHHVRDLKLKALERDNRGDVIPHFTVDSPIPYSLADLLAALQTDDEERVPGARPNTDKAGPFFGTLSRFIARLRSRTEDRRYSFMFDPDPETNEYEWLHGFAEMLLSTDPGIKIVDFSEVPSDVLPVVVGVLARLLYEVHFWTAPEKRTPVTFVCDEAHLYVPETGDGVVSQRAVEAFERIAKEGRKYGISLMIVSQRPSDVSRTVLSQCNNFIVLRLTNDQDQALVRRLMPDSLGGITAALPLLDVGEAIVLGDAMVLPTRVRLHKPDIEPRSATMDFWTDWGTKKVDSNDLISAVEAMRRQSRVHAIAVDVTADGAVGPLKMSTVSNGA